MVHKFHDIILRLLRSPKFFYGVVGLLVLQAAWIALTARYPQAFDENYHLGLIQLHAHQWIPFFTSQPPGSAVHGAIVRDPSYLYHYLLSFPYRLLAGTTSSLAAQVIVLRFINIAIFVAGLFVFRKLLAELRASTAVSNLILLFLVLLPVVPLLAGQINYDNLMFLLAGLLFMLTVRYLRLLYGTLPIDSRSLGFLILQLLFVGAAGSIIKFPFAPIFFATAAILGLLTWRQLHSRRAALQALSIGARADRIRLVLWSGLAALALVLCLERYGLNLVRYHAPVPKCDKVLSVEECQQYSPWARDHMFAATYPRPSLHGIIVYPGVWVHRTVYETVFTITSYIDPAWGTVTYKPYAPLTIANYTAWAVVTVAFVAMLRYWRRLWDDVGLRVLLLVSIFYILVLFVQNLLMYLHTGEAVAIHGRYLVPVYPVLMLAAALSVATFMREFRRGALRKYRGLLAVIVLLLFLQGGGIVGWIVKSDPTWYWQQSQPAARANWLVKDVLNTVVHD